ncbi:MAG: hypothetical protein JW827_02300, partial [Spirochaetes bacterium]|nr:hypothetical protein [Spirochaetota bacterium]
FTIDIDNIMKDLLSRHRDILSSIVVNEKGLLVYHPLKDHIGEYVGHFSLIRDIIKSNEDLVIQSSKQIFLKKKISPLNWYIISKANPDKFIFSYNKPALFSYTLVLFFLFEACAFVLIFLLFNKYITRSVNLISYNMKNLLHGRPNSEVSLSSYAAEFQMLENRFNRLVNRVGGYIVFGRTMPQEIVEEYINQSIDKINPDRRSGSVLYLKIKNINDLQDHYTKEDMEKVLNKFLNDVEMIVTKFKGFIDYFSSDSFLAVFGVPFNHYDYNQNCVNCALAIFKELRKQNKSNTLPVVISISVNTGELFYSQLRSNYGKFYVNIGDTIRDAYHYESVTMNNILAMPDITFKNLKRKLKMEKTVHLKIRDKEEETMLHVKKFEA